MNCTHEIDEPLPALINGQPVCDDCATANERRIAMDDTEFIAAWKRGELHFYYTHDPKILKFLEECSTEWPCEHGVSGGCEED